MPANAAAGSTAGPEPVCGGACSGSTGACIPRIVFACELGVAPGGGAPGAPGAPGGCGIGGIGAPGAAPACIAARCCAADGTGIDIMPSGEIVLSSTPLVCGGGVAPDGRPADDD